MAKVNNIHPVMHHISLWSTYVVNVIVLAWMLCMWQVVKTKVIHIDSGATSPTHYMNGVKVWICSLSVFIHLKGSIVLSITLLWSNYSIIAKDNFHPVKHSSQLSDLLGKCSSDSSVPLFVSLCSMFIILF